MRQAQPSDLRLLADCADREREAVDLQSRTMKMESGRLACRERSLELSNAAFRARKDADMYEGR